MPRVCQFCFEKKPRTYKNDITWGNHLRWIHWMPEKTIEELLAEGKDEFKELIKKTTQKEKEKLLYETL